MQHAAPVVSEKRAIILDDDKAAQEVIRDVCALSAWSAECLNVPEAISRLSGGEADFLIILDLHMPGTDGIELLTKLPMQPQGRGQKVLIVSGADPAIVTSAENLLEAYGHELVGSLRKPFSILELIEILRSTQAPPGMR